MTSFWEYLKPKKQNLILTGVLLGVYTLTMVLAAGFDIVLNISMPTGEIQTDYIVSSLVFTVIAFYLEASVALYWVNERFY